MKNRNGENVSPSEGDEDFNLPFVLRLKNKHHGNADRHRQKQKKVCHVERFRDCTDLHQFENAFFSVKNYEAD